MDEADIIRTIVTFVVGGGGIGFLSAFLSRRGQKEEFQQARVAQAATERLAEAQQDREALAAERVENSRIRTLNGELDTRLAEQRSRHAEEVNRIRTESDTARAAMQQSFDTTVRRLTEDLTAMQSIVLGQVKHIANGGTIADIEHAAVVDTGDFIV